MYIQQSSELFLEFASFRIMKILKLIQLFCGFLQWNSWSAFFKVARQEILIFVGFRLSLSCCIAKHMALAFFHIWSQGFTIHQTSFISHSELWIQVSLKSICRLSGYVGTESEWTAYPASSESPTNQVSWALWNHYYVWVDQCQVQNSMWLQRLPSILPLSPWLESFRLIKTPTLEETSSQGYQTFQLETLVSSLPFSVSPSLLSFLLSLVQVSSAE